MLAALRSYWRSSISISTFRSLMSLHLFMRGSRSIARIRFNGDWLSVESMNTILQVIGSLYGIIRAVPLLQNPINERTITILPNSSQGSSMSFGVIVTLVAIGSFAWWSTKSSRWRHPPLPPGPRPDPIIGHLRIMPAKDSHLFFYELSKKYGQSESVTMICLTILSI